MSNKINGPVSLAADLADRAHGVASRAVATVAAVAAVISYRHIYELVSTYGEIGVTARLVPFIVDGLILAASMLTLDANRRYQRIPPLARWCHSASSTNAFLASQTIPG